MLSDPSVGRAKVAAAAAAAGEEEAAPAAVQHTMQGVERLMRPPLLRCPFLVTAKQTILVELNVLLSIIWAKKVKTAKTNMVS